MTGTRRTGEGGGGVASLVLLISSVPSVSASKEFASEALSCHNEYRRKHQAPPLKLNSRLNKEATRWVHAPQNSKPQEPHQLQSLR